MCYIIHLFHCVLFPTSDDADAAFFQTSLAAHVLDDVVEVTAKTLHVVVWRIDDRLTFQRPEHRFAHHLVNDELYFVLFTLTKHVADVIGDEWTQAVEHLAQFDSRFLVAAIELEYIGWKYI